MMKCRIISDLSVFEAIRGKWNDLAANFRSPLLSHEWVVAGIEAFCSKHCPPAVFVVQSGVELKAAAPLTIVCRGGVPRLEPVGACHLGEPCGFLYESDEALEALLKTILDFSHSFALLRFDIKAQELTALRKLRSKGSMHIYKSAESSLWAPLTSRWDDFEATISSGRRSDLRRYRRRAERLGEMKFEVLYPTVDTLAPYLKEFFQVEASGWKGRNGSAIISSPGTAEFFRRYAQKAAGLRMLRMFFLKIDGKTAAARMAVEYNRRLWDLKIAYDEAFSECSLREFCLHMKPCAMPSIRGWRHMNF